MEPMTDIETGARTTNVLWKYTPCLCVKNYSVNEKMMSRRCRAKLITCCGLPVRPEVILVTVVVLLAGVIGLVFTVCRLHVKMNKLEALVLKIVQEDVAVLRWKGETQSTPESAEYQSLYERTVQLLNKRYDPEPSILLETGSGNQTQSEATVENDVIESGPFLKRSRRDVAKSPQKTVGNNSKNQNNTANKSGNARGSGDKGAGHLESSHFEVDFYNDWYNHKTNFSIHECITDDRWPTKPVACRGRTIKYSQSDSPLAFFRTRKTAEQSAGHKKKKRKSNRPLMEITDQKEGIFGVRESGIYLIHLSIMIVDESHTHSLGITLNNQTVLTCHRGGFRCPQTNVEGSYKYRICVIDGVLEMNAKDQLQIKTVEKDTVVKLVSERKSQFKTLLLHKISP